MNGINVKRTCLVLAVTILALAWHGHAWAGRIDAGLENRLRQAGPDQMLPVIIRATGTLPGAALKRQLATRYATRAGRHRAAVETLRATARTTQAAILRELDGPAFAGRVDNVKGFWIDNVITAKMTPSAIAEIADRIDVDIVYSFPKVELVKPIGIPDLTASSTAVQGVVPGLRAIKADSLWAMGLTGKGRLVASLDTGVDGKHIFLSDKWRGHNGYSVAESWWNPQGDDTIPHTFPGGGVSHGTWVMGIMVAIQDTAVVGDPYLDTVGVAYDAQWISAAAIDVSGANIIEAMQWVADPDGDPNTETDVPDVVNNSWGIAMLDANGRFDTTGGCTDVFWNAIDNVEAAGAVMLFAAGNEGGFGPMTIRNPGNRITSETNTFSVGMIDAGNPSYPIDVRSSQGPSVCDQATIKPEVVAPGVGIQTTNPGDFMAQNVVGTSFSVPYVAGGVALLREYNPNATVEQIKTALLNSAQDLGTSGPDNLYGNGLIDLPAALRALPSNTQPNLYIKRDYYTRPAPGTETDMVIVLRSSGTAVNNVSVTITSDDPHVTITSGNAVFGDFTAIGDTAGNFGSPFHIAIDNQVLPGERLPLQFTINGDDGYTHTVHGALQVGPAQSTEVFTHDAGNFRMTVTAQGLFGVQPNGLNPRFGGQGYFYDDDTTQSLFEGGFLVGIDAVHVSDNVRDRLQESDIDFQLDPGGRMSVSEPGAEFAEETRSAFSDAAAENPLGLFIVQRTMVSSDSASDDYLIVEYTIYNRSVATLSGLRAGLFFDWDFPFARSVGDAMAATRDGGGFNAAEGVGWMKHRDQNRYRGLAVLTSPGVTSYRYLDNPVEIYNGFTDMEKWNAMSEGFVRTEPATTGDGSHLIATGPFTLAPDSAVTVAFAIIGATSEADLIASARDARSRYARGTNGTLETVPTTLSFNAKTGGVPPPSQMLTINNTAGFAVNFSVDHLPAWSEVTPLSGQIPNNEAAVLDVGIAVDLDTVAPGTYADSLLMTTDDSLHSPLVVPVSLTITAVSVAAVDPNPFNPNIGPVKLHFQIPKSARLRTAVYDIAGNKVADLLDSEEPAGLINLTWPGKKDGRNLADGVYFFHVTAGSFKKTFTIVLRK